MTTYSTYIGTLDAANQGTVQLKSSLITLNGVTLSLPSQSAINNPTVHAPVFISADGVRAGTG